MAAEEQEETRRVEMEVDGDSGQGDIANAAGLCPKLPWVPLQKYFSEVKDKNETNFVAKCNRCKKNYSCAKSSASNFEKHLVSAAYSTIGLSIFQCILFVWKQSNERYAVHEP